MRKFELTLPVHYAETREILVAAAGFVKRSQIDDVYFETQSGAVARLRRQDTISRLSCTQPLNHAETIVLDFRACLQLLTMSGFNETENVRLLRETWRKFQYTLHLDRVETQGDFLTLEAESQTPDALRPFGHAQGRQRRLALKFLKSMGISVLKAGVDKKPASAYTGADLNLDSRWSLPPRKRGRE